MQLNRKQGDKMKSIVLIILCFVVLVTAGCSKDSPMDVAEGFWIAMADRDLETARSFVTKETANSMTWNNNAGNGDFTVKFGDVTEEVSYSAVETIMIPSDGDMEMEITLRTIVVKEEGKWKVDANRTMMSMFGGAMGEMMQQLGEVMKDGMEEFGKGMQESMEQMQREMEREMNKDWNNTGPVAFQN